MYYARTDLICDDYLMAILDDKFGMSVTLLKDLRPGTKNVTCLFIVIDRGQC